VLVTGASYSLSVLICVIDLLYHFWGFGFFVFQLFLHIFISQDAQSIITDADPAMSSKAQGGLPRAQASRQGSRASGGPCQRNEAKIKRK
jgi:hypothetical protein